MKFLMVIAPKDWRDEEYFQPKEILEKGGVEVVTASLQTGKTFGYLDGEAEANLTVGDVDVADYAGVAFIGGQGMVPLINETKFVELAKKFYQAGKLTCAICIAPVILANAGLLQGKKATCWEGAKKTLQDKGADFTGEAATQDGLLITGSGPAAAEEFGQIIHKALLTGPGPVAKI